MSARTMTKFAMLGALLLLSVPAQAQVKPKVAGLAETPKTMILIGNSFFYYNNGLHSQLSGLMRADDPKTRYSATLATISGSGMNWHNVEAYFASDGMASYSFDENNNVVMNSREKKFDAAIMMDCSQCPIHPELKSIFTEYSAKQIATVRKYDTAPVLFMSWAYADKPEMTAQLADAYTAAGNANNALVIPAG